MKALIHNGEFRTWLRDDMPEGWSPGEGEQLVEAEFVDTPQPTPTDAKLAEESYSFDAEALTVTRTWTVRDKTRDELVPAEVPFGAFQAALELAGVDLAGVVAALDLLPEPQRTVAKWKWLKATIAERDDQLLRQIGYQVGKTDAEIDQVFVVAKAIWG